MPDSNPISSVKLRWLPDITTSHSTRLSKNDRQVAGYNRASSTVCVVRLSPPLRLGSGQACLTFEIELE